MKKKKENIALFVKHKQSSFVESTKSSLENSGFSVKVFDNKESLSLFIVSKSPKIVFVSNKLKKIDHNSMIKNIKARYKINATVLNETIDPDQEDEAESSKGSGIFARFGGSNKSAKNKRKKSKRTMFSNNGRANKNKEKSGRSFGYKKGSANESNKSEKKGSALDRLLTNKNNPDMKKPDNTKGGYLPKKQAKAAESKSFNSLSENNNAVAAETDKKKKSSMFRNGSEKSSVSSTSGLNSNKDGANSAEKKKKSSMFNNGSEKSSGSSTSGLNSNKDSANNAEKKKKSSMFKNGSGNSSEAITSGLDDNQSDASTKGESKSSIKNSKSNSEGMLPDFASNSPDLSNNDQDNTNNSNLIAQKDLNQNLNKDNSMENNINTSKSFASESKKQTSAETIELFRETLPNINIVKKDENISEASDKYFICSAIIDQAQGYLFFNTKNRTAVENYLDSTPSSTLVGEITSSNKDAVKNLDLKLLGNIKLEEESFTVSFLQSYIIEIDYSLVNNKYEISSSYFHVEDLVNFPIYLYLKNNKKDVKIIRGNTKLTQKNLDLYKNNGKKFRFDEKDKALVLTHILMSNLKKAS